MLGAVLLATGFLVSLSSAASCKNVSYGYYEMPLDVCVESSSSGTKYSTKYSCSSDKTEIELTAYTSSGCKGTSYSTSYSASEFNCDGSTCSDVAMIRSYTSSSCASSTTYYDQYLVMGDCIAYGSTTSIMSDCSMGNVTMWYFDSMDCSGNATTWVTQFYDGECSSGSYYYEVTCDASLGGSSDSSMIQLSFALFTFVAFIASLL